MSLYILTLVQSQCETDNFMGSLLENHGVVIFPLKVRPSHWTVQEGAEVLDDEASVDSTHDDIPITKGK